MWVHARKCTHYGYVNRWRRRPVVLDPRRGAGQWWLWCRPGSECWGKATHHWESHFHALLRKWWWKQYGRAGIWRWWSKHIWVGRTCKDRICVLLSRAEYVQNHWMRARQITKFAGWVVAIRTVGLQDPLRHQRKEACESKFAQSLFLGWAGQAVRPLLHRDRTQRAWAVKSYRRHLHGWTRSSTSQSGSAWIYWRRIQGTKRADIDSIEVEEESPTS